MLADGVGAGIEQAVDRVLLVLLLLVHHRAILPTGIAIVLRCDAVAVFGDVTVGGQKIISRSLGTGWARGRGAIRSKDRKCKNL